MRPYQATRRVILENAGPGSADTITRNRYPVCTSIRPRLLQGDRYGGYKDDAQSGRMIVKNYRTAASNSAIAIDLTGPLSLKY